MQRNMLTLLKNYINFQRVAWKWFLFFPLCLVLVCLRESAAYELGDVQVHGFASQGYILTKGNNYLAEGTQGNGSLDFNEFALNASWQATDSLRIGGQVMSRKFGGDGHNNLYIDWGVIDYHLNEYFGLQLGKFKIPVGFYNQTRDIDLARVNVFLPQSIYTEAFRPFFSSSLGGLIYGNLALKQAGNLEYEFFYGKAEEDNDSCLVRSLQIMTNGHNMNMESNGVYGGALRYNTPLPGLRLGYSVTKGDADFDYSNPYGRSFIKGGAAPGHVLSMEYGPGDFTLSSEWMRTEQDSTFITATPYGYQQTTSTTPAEGYYVNGAYIVTDWLEMSLQYEVYYKNRHDKDGRSLLDKEPANPYNPLVPIHFGAWQKTVSLAARFDVTDFWLIKAEAQYIDGTALLSPVYNAERDCRRYWNMFSLKTTLFF